MIEVNITDDMMNAARKKAQEMGLINNFYSEECR